MKHHIFIIGSVWIEPQSSAAGGRMLQLIHLFLEQNWKVTFGTVSQKNPNSIDLTQFGVKEESIELNNTSFDEKIKELNPSIIVFDRFMTEEQFGWRVSEHCPNALKILDTEDLHCLRKIRHDALKKSIEFSNDLLLNSDIAKREIASMYRCDMSLIISSYEMKILKDVFQVPEELFYHLPFLLEEIDKAKEKSWKVFKERNHFISIGNFIHAPNLDATIQLKKVVWPIIRKQLPEAELHIYGAYPTQQVLEFNNPKEGFFVHGFIEEANEVIEKSSVLLAPLRFGAGIKGKLTDAMLNGTPSITTRIGAEGMCENLEWNGYIEDDFTRFSKRAIELYSNVKLWNQAQKKGIEIINQHYSKEKLSIGFLNNMITVFNNLEQHRNQNFTGKMLAHHSLQSLKYMGKWIEEKNK